MSVKASIVIPVYNAMPYLEQCLDSVGSQSLRDIEIILVDDGSTDDSWRMIQAYSGRDARVRGFRQNRGGAGAARNRGIAESKGEYIAFMDADDYYPDEQVLERLYVAAKKNETLIAGGNIVQLKNDELILTTDFTAEGIVPYHDYQDCYYFYRFIYSWKLLFDRMPCFPPYRRFQDPVFMVEAMNRAGKFCAVPIGSYVYRIQYKQVFFTVEKAQDNLSGISDVFHSAHEHDYRLMYEKRLRGILEDCLPFFYRYAAEDDKKIWELLEDIYHVRENWLGNVEPRWTRMTLKEYAAACQKERDSLVNRLRGRVNIIYGAGHAGGLVWQCCKETGSALLGFAVSDRDAATEKMGYGVRPIEDYIEYRDKAQVIIAVMNEATQRSIGRTLQSLGFAQVYVFDYKKIEVIMGSVMGGCNKEWLNKCQ